MSQDPHKVVAAMEASSALLPKDDPKPQNTGGPPVPPAQTQLAWPHIWAAMLLVSLLATVLSQLARGGVGHASFITVLCLTVFFAAAAFDAATGRVPNPLTYTAILLGLGLNCVPTLLRLIHSGAGQWLGAAGPTQALLGFAFCATLGLVCMLAPGGFGGGDLKLVAAAGAMLGLRHVGLVMVYGLVVAVVYSVLNLLIAGRLTRMLRDAAIDVMTVLWLRQAPPAVISRRHIPLGVPLFLGLLLTGIIQAGRLPAWLGGLT